MSVILFILMIPVSVYIYACALAIIDAQSKVGAVTRFVTVLIVIMLWAVFVSRAVMEPLIISLGVVVALHWLTFFGIRNFGLGMPVYQNRPPPEPANEDEQSDFESQ